MSSSTASSVVGRQPDRARRPGVLVATSCTPAAAAATRRARRRPRSTAASATALGDEQVGVERQVRAVLLDGPERLDDDAALGRARATTVGRAQVGEVAVARSHVAHATGGHDAALADAARMAACRAPDDGLRRDRRRRRAQRPGDRRLPRPGRAAHARCSRPAPTVGGTAASEPFAGATVNICNCDHLTFRTTPVIDELDLADHGLRYLDIEPAQLNMTWAERPAVVAATTTSSATLDELGAHVPRRGRRLPALRSRPRCRRCG